MADGHLRIVTLMVWSGNAMVEKYGFDAVGHWPYDS